MSVLNITPHQKNILGSLIASGLSNQQIIYQFYMIRQNMYRFQPYQQIGGDTQKSSEFPSSDSQGPSNEPLHMSYGSQGSQRSSESPQGSQRWASPGAHVAESQVPPTGHQGFHDRANYWGSGGALRAGTSGPQYTGATGSQGPLGPSNGPTGAVGSQRYYGYPFPFGSYPYMAYGVAAGGQGCPGPQSTGLNPAGSSGFQGSQNMSSGSPGLQNFSGPPDAPTQTPGSFGSKWSYGSQNMSSGSQNFSGSPYAPIGTQFPPGSTSGPQSSSEFPEPSGSSNGAAESQQSQRYYGFPFLYASYPFMVYAPVGSQGYFGPQSYGTPPTSSGSHGPTRPQRKAPKTTVVVYKRRLYDNRYDPRELAKLMDIDSATLRQQIKEWTQERGITQKKIADDLGVCSSTISRYLGNKGYVSAILEQSILVWFLQYRDAWNRVKHARGQMLRIPYNRPTPLAICAANP
ncbi:hypothetical protein GCK72_011765 [Caenorhabditis remanei]|uniref:HTH cro/C1-type domain-containing protein n=1 Tax=Caenorhabditis remanei TaxID=31234 RepID=A0A6A5H8Y5_CAERE|nr:hypothetical protein GCK72_011765 [Caenorhabditis remanei]KAF1763499.1 hypothetical protein GCK72_011765 [Caenorhabditis remanei]